MTNNQLKNKKYWEERAERTIQQGEKKATVMLEDLLKAYKHSDKEIEKEINAFYGKYATEQGLSYEEVQKRLNKSELKQYKEQTKEYYDAIKATNYAYDPAYREKLHRELSAKSYMSRLEALRANIQHEIEELYAIQQELFKTNLEETYEETYYKTLYNIQKGTGIGSKVTPLSKLALEKAVATKWDGNNYSSNIWHDKDALTRAIDKALPQAFIQGHSPKKLAKTIVKMVDGEIKDKSTYRKAYNKAVRLARTEFNHVANSAITESYKECGVEYYEILATFDNRVSDKCKMWLNLPIKDRVFPVGQEITGVNFPPFHPNCRTTTIPYFPKDEIDAMFDKEQRIAKDKNGKYFYVDYDITYDEWEKLAFKNK